MNAGLNISSVCVKHGLDLLRSAWICHTMSFQLQMQKDQIVCKESTPEIVAALEL